MNEYKKIIKDIESKRKLIIKNLKYESIETYIFLQSELKKDKELTKNYLFQFIFRSFYKLDNAGLTDGFKEQFFVYFQKYRSCPDKFDLKSAIVEFSKLKTIQGKESIQFSFFTKMYHSINVKKPIYDKEVAKVFGFPRYYVSNVEKRIERLLYQYQIIEGTYERIAKEQELENIITDFDNKFKSNMPLTMKYDFIFWQAGKLL